MCLDMYQLAPHPGIHPMSHTLASYPHTCAIIDDTHAGESLGRYMYEARYQHDSIPIAQIHPLYLTPSLLDQVCNNFTVVEVWHKTPGTASDDEV